VKKILAYIDPRPKSVVVLERAVALAAAMGADVTAIDVLSPPFYWRSRADLHALAVAERRMTLEGLVAQVARQGVNVDVAVRTGKTTVELVRAAVEGGFDLVIKGAKGRAEGGLSIFGTTAMHLIRKCPVPVWVVGETVKPPTPPKVLAAIDPGWEEDGDPFSVKILKQAARLADWLGGELHVCHAWDFENELLLSRHLSSAELACMALDERRAGQRRVRCVLEVAEHPLQPSRIHLLKGPAEIEIARLAFEGAFHVVVMGSVGRSGIMGMLIGEMAEKLIARLNCGVLCIKPDGFVSPIRPALSPP
jgi:nucleotide-binding universal stress UspA family protein